MKYKDIYEFIKLYAVSCIVTGLFLYPPFLAVLYFLIGDSLSGVKGEDLFIKSTLAMGFIMAAVLWKGHKENGYKFKQ